MICMLCGCCVHQDSQYKSQHIRIIFLKKKKFTGTMASTSSPFNSVPDSNVVVQKKQNIVINHFLFNVVTNADSLLCLCMLIM